MGSTQKVLWSEQHRETPEILLKNRRVIGHIELTDLADRLLGRESDTEDDCLRHSRRLVEAGQRTYFSEITGVWVQMAYGRNAPSEEAVRRLCETWPFEVSEREGAS